ncbi:hypothetical protein ACFL2H_10140, partial [Planctomycetota bacterium]
GEFLSIRRTSDSTVENSFHPCFVACSACWYDAAFVRSRSETKRAEIVTLLTSSGKYKSEFDNHWAIVLHAQIGDVADAKSVAAAIQEDLPYDRLLQQVVRNSKTDLEGVCKNLLGARMDCAKCHSELGPSKDKLEMFADGFQKQRQEFSQAVSRSDEASEMLVNHVWEHFLGARLTPDFAFSTEERNVILRPTLQRLTQEFIASNYDTRKLACWVALSEPFGLSDQMVSGNAGDSAIALQPLFARHYTNGGFADSITQSLNKFAAADIDLVGKNATPVKAVASLEPQLESRDTIKRAKVDWEDIAFMNSDPDRTNILKQRGPYLERLAKADLRSHEKVEHIFLSVVGRMPTQAEREPAIVILRSQESNAILGLRDIWWAISKGR